MGANMARRLNGMGYPVTSACDFETNGARKLAAEVGAEACTNIARLTELSGVITAVVTDDKAHLHIFTHKKDNVLMGAKGRVFVNCATITPGVHVQVEKLAGKAKAGSREGCVAGANSRVLVTDGEDMMNRDHPCFFDAAHRNASRSFMNTNNHD